MKILSLLGQVSWKKLAIAIVLSLISGASATLIIKNIHTGLKDGIQDIQGFMILFSVLLLFFSISAIISTRMLSGLTQKVLFDLRVNISKKVLEADFEKIEYKGSNIYTILTEDINTILRMVSKLPGLFTSLTTAFGCFIYLFFLSWELSLMVVTIFLVVFLVIQLSNPRLRYYAGKSRESMIDIFERFDELIHGLKELSLDANHKKEFINKELPEACGIHMGYKVKEDINIQLTSKISEILLLSGIAIILIAISVFDFVPLTTFSEFLTITLFIVTPLAASSEFMKLLKPVEIAFGQIESIGIELEKIAKVRDQTLRPDEDAGTLIDLKDVSYEYYSLEDDSYFILGPLDLSIEKGELLFLVGGNGSGKTTLAKILTGLYIPRSGEVIYKGDRVVESKLDSYRHQFTALFTDNYLFEKLGYLKELDPAKARHLLKLLELDHKLKLDGKSYSTTRLSSGQKKRLSLLTAILENKEIYLFDEWAANQDPHFKRIFYREIIPHLTNDGKTVIVISHDEQYFDLADRVVFLVDGKIQDIKTFATSLS